MEEILNKMYAGYSHGYNFCLKVYDLGSDGQGMSRVASVSQNSIVSAAGNIAR